MHLTRLHDTAGRTNPVAFTKKPQGTRVLPVAFCCTGIQEHK